MNDFMMDMARIVVVCIIGAPCILLVFFIFGVKTETDPKVGRIFRCPSRHPRWGRCALDPHHWGQPHQARRGRRTWR